LGLLLRPVTKEAAIRGLGGTSAEFIGGLRAVILA
jgi:hypothetical protein